MGAENGGPTSGGPLRPSNRRGSRATSGTPWGDGVLERLRSPVLDAVTGLTGVWVVGGAVRDALLGRDPKELDLLVEGDATEVVRALGVPTVTHDRFGTYIVAETDVAVARYET